MASNGLQYFTTYLQSHEERYAKFRDEAYEELILEKQLEDEYRKALREREKILQDAVNKARAGGAEGIDALEIIKEERANVQAQTASKNEARAQRLNMRENLQGQLTVPQAAQTKLAEAANTLATSGSLILDPAGVRALMEGQVTDISASVKGGTRSAASTAQQLWKQLKTDKNWGRLSAADREALEQNITAKFGLDTVNIGGISGDGLLDTPQDVLLQKELDLLLGQEGGAFGIKDLRALQAQLDKLLAENADPALIAAKQAEIDAELAPEREALSDVRKELAKPPSAAFPPSEADVRKRAAEKYGFEAPAFMKQQFARDVLGTDKDKLLHYDAIQAAKASPADKESDAYKQALMLSQNRSLLGESKAEQRANILSKAFDFAKGQDDIAAARDKFLIAYHQIQLEEQRGKYEQSTVLPEPVSAAEPASAARLPDYIANTEGFKTDEEGFLIRDEPRMGPEIKGKEPVYVPKFLREPDPVSAFISKDRSLPGKTGEGLKRLQQQLTIEDLFKSDI
jgi:hypothetical protein